MLGTCQIYDPSFGIATAMVESGFPPCRRRMSTFSDCEFGSGVQVMVKAEPAGRSCPFPGAMRMLPEEAPEGFCWARVGVRRVRRTGRSLKCMVVLIRVDMGDWRRW